MKRGFESARERKFPGVRLMTVAALGLILNGCATPEPSPGPAARRQQPAVPVRTELVLLNMTEASGWVGYTCSESAEGEMEDYRVVVIRQQTGDIIYDSQVLLATDLCTHGFEMAPDDPRLEQLARNVDRSIIEPLEAFQRAQPTPAEPEDTDPDIEEDVQEITSVTDDPSEEDEPARAEIALYVLVSVDGEQAEVEFSPEAPLEPGDRLFVRTPPNRITLPGSDEQILTTEGEVSGLVQVTHVEETTATVNLLSGEFPDDPHLEKAARP